MSLFQNDPPKPSSSEPNKSKSIFDKNSLGALKSDIRERFMRMSDQTTIEHTMKPWEKSHLVEDLFPSHYGDHISRQEVDKKIKELNQLKYTVKDPAEKAEFQDKIDFLNKLKGM